MESEMRETSMSTRALGRISSSAGSMPARPESVRERCAMLKARYDEAAAKADRLEKILESQPGLEEALDLMRELGV